MEPRHSSLILAHGGVWNQNVYEGGRKEYIPLPTGGITYEDLLSKLEIRLKKDKSMFMFEVDALVNSPTGEIMRMKITDDFELGCLMNLLELPVVYVVVCERDVESRPKQSRRNCVQSHTRNDVVYNEDITVSDCHSHDIYDAENNMSSPDIGDELHDVSGETVVDVSHCVSGETVGSELHDYITEDHEIMVLLDASYETSAESSVSKRTWVVPGAEYHASLPCEELVVVDQLVVGELVIGGFFSDKECMKEVLGLYHLKNYFEFVTRKSDKCRYVVRCKFRHRCEFVMRARSVGKGWRIYEWTDHTCENDFRYHGVPKVSSKVIASYFGPNLEHGAILRPRDIQGQILREYGVHVKYHTALSGRNQALNVRYGDPDKSFQVLPIYLYMLEASNPGSVVDLQARDDGVFEYCYFALSASIRAFRSCRPVFVIDATHLKGKYNGVMYIAATKDGNEQIVPLAFGIGDKENDSSWNWFLQQVRRTFGCPPNSLIVSDQHPSIKNAVRSVFLGTHHGLCTYHIQGNLKTWGSVVIEIFQAAASCYKNQHFDEHMKNLMSTEPRAYTKLMNLDPCRWARSKCPVRRYEYGTSNGAEVLNACLRWARKLPVCPLLETARTLVQKWYYERRTIAGARTQELTVKATKILGKAVEAGRSMKVEPITDTVFKVISGSKSNVVDIVKKTCSCLVFDFDLIPCSHAAAAISHVRQSPLSYVDKYYTTETWREIYSGEVMPVPDKDDWIVPPEVESRVILTPKNTRQAGRPRTRRMQAGSSSKRKRACSRCHQTGHYENTCKVVLQIIPQEEEQGIIHLPSAKKPRNKKKCGICGVVGHTRKKCTDPNRF